VVDNGSGHRSHKAARRLRAAWPNAIVIHTPVHASWPNQVETFFSIVQEKVLSPKRLRQHRQLAATLLAFAGRYNRTARPFNWKFGAADQTGMLGRLDARQEPAQLGSLPEAA
jgi:hypothetical protein